MTRIVSVRKLLVPLTFSSFRKFRNKNQFPVYCCHQRSRSNQQYQVEIQPSRVVSLAAKLSHLFISANVSLIYIYIDPCLG